MAEPSYVERSSLGTRTLSLDGHWLRVSGRWGLKHINVRVDLRQANPNLQSKNMRLYPAIIWAFTIAVAPALILIGIPGRFLPDPKLAATLEMAAIAWMTVCLWQGWRYLPRTDFVRVRAKQGKVLLDIVKDRRGSDEFTAFLAELKARIESSAVS